MSSPLFANLLSVGRGWLSPTVETTSRQLATSPARLTAGLSAPSSTPAPPAQKIITLDLSIVRADAVYEVSGTVIWYQSSTNPSDVVSIRNNDTTSDAVPFRPGNAIGGIRFLRLLISNDVVSGATATLVVMTETPGAALPVQLR